MGDLIQYTSIDTQPTVKLLRILFKFKIRAIVEEPFLWLNSIDGFEQRMYDRQMMLAL